MYSTLRIPDSSLCQWNLDSQFQSLVKFQILWAVLWILKPRNPDCTSKIFPDFGIENPLHWAKLFCYFNEGRPWPTDWIAPECTVMRGFYIKYLDRQNKWLFLGHIPTCEGGKLWFSQRSLSLPLLQVHSLRARPKLVQSTVAVNWKWWQGE